VQEKGIEIDPKKVKAICSVKAPTCRKDLQKLLGKINYLRRFIYNLSGKVNAFTPLLQLKNDVDFTWGAKQQEAFDEIKSYLTSPPVLQAPKSDIHFKLYVVAEKDVIEAILTQKKSKARSTLLHMRVEECWTPKQGTLFLKSYVYHYIILVPS
jgi:hypothetical protein